MGERVEEEKERCHFYSYDENISHLWVNVRLFFVCVKLSSTSEDKIPRRNLHSPPLSFVHSLQWHVCLCSFGTKRSCFSFTTATDVFCFFSRVHFLFAIVKWAEREKETDGKFSCFCSHCIVNLGVSHHNQHLFRFTHSFFSMQSEMLRKIFGLAHFFYDSIVRWISVMFEIFDFFTQVTSDFSTFR